MHVERAPKQFTPLWWKDVHKEIAIPSALQYTSCTSSDSPLTMNEAWSQRLGCYTCGTPPTKSFLESTPLIAPLLKQTTQSLVSETDYYAY